MVSRLISWTKRYGGCLWRLALGVCLFWLLGRLFELNWLETIGAALGIILGFLIFSFVIAYFSTPRLEEPFFSYGNESYSVEVDFSSPLNRGALEYLKKSRPERKAEWESISPLSVKNPILGTNTRRSIGVRLWSDLAASLPVECRWIVLGTPALVHPETGVLFGVSIGNQYFLRLTDADMASALKAEASTEDGLSDRRTPEMASELGPGWVFGSWQLAELAWCRAAYEALRAATGEAAPEAGA
jgi:hypothetical protein